MYCAAIRRGDIFIFEKKEKQTAVVVLQDDILNNGLSTVVCAVIEPMQEEKEIFPNEIVLREYETGLGEDGICMLHNIVTVDRRMIVAKKGELGEKKLQEIYEAVDVNLGRFRDRLKN